MTILKMVLSGAGGCVLGFIGAALFGRFAARIRKNRSTSAKKRKENPISRFGTMNLILVLICIYFIWFTNRMIEIYEATNGIPDVLCQCVFAFLGGECGIMGWIKTTKERRQDRKWADEDRQRMEHEAQQSAQDFEPSYTAEQKNRDQ